MIAHSHSQAEGRARRERYYQLRRDGVPMVEAAWAVDVPDPVTYRRYERWFQAIESGRQLFPARKADAA